MGKSRSAAVSQRKTMLLSLILAAVLLRGSASQITIHGNTKAAYGADAHYRCELANPTGVLQVTWQRHFKDESIENLATYSKRFGTQVNEPYSGKIRFTKASLSSTSITLVNVTWEDAGCYICSFNAYPDGSKRKQTCLTVQGISEVATDAQVRIGGHEGGEGEEVEEVVFRCSATGKPAPTVQWDSAGFARSEEPQTATVLNDDGTLTSSSNLTLRVPSGSSGHVECVLNSGAMGHRRKKIPFTVHARDQKRNERGKVLTQSGVALVACTVLFITCVTIAAAAAAFKRRRLKDTRRDENI